MKAIIIAAGLGSRLNPLTKGLPKCLLKVSGKSILEHQLDTLRSCGVDNISIIKGYKKEKINYPNIKYYIDPDPQGILSSLMYAELGIKNDVIVSYADILYSKMVIEKLLEIKGDIVAVVDTDWEGYYKGRTEHPTEEAENVIIKKGKIIKIGKHTSAKRAQGEFIGIFKLSHQGAMIFREEFQKAKEKYGGKPFQHAPMFKKAYLTDMLQEIIDNGYDIQPAKIQQNWWEIDTKQDLEKVRKIFSNFKDNNF